MKIVSGLKMMSLDR